jgi:ribosomal protein S27E
MLKGMNESVTCPRCGAVNAVSARFCQQCGLSLLGPAGGKGVPNPNTQQPTGTPVPQQQQQPGGPQGQGQNWGQTMLGGLAGFVLGSMLGGGRGGWGGWGGWGGGGWGDHDGGDGDWGGGGDFGGGDFGGGGDG